MIEISTPNAPRPAGHYSQAIEHGGMVYVSGQLPIDPQTGEKRAGSIEEQTEQTLRNIEGVLNAAGASFANVVNMRVCLRDSADFPKFNEAFTAFMRGEKVTRTCIGGTPHRAGVNVEIDCIAMFD